MPLSDILYIILHINYRFHDNIGTSVIVSKTKLAIAKSTNVYLYDCNNSDDEVHLSFIAIKKQHIGNLFLINQNVKT